MKKGIIKSPSVKREHRQKTRKDWKEERQVLREKWGEQGRQILPGKKKA